MLNLTATGVTGDQLRALRDANPDLFATVTERISELRAEPGGKAAGRAFLLEDGTTAGLATFYDHVAGHDLVLVWVIDVDDTPTTTSRGTLRIVRVEHV